MHENRLYVLPLKLFVEQELFSPCIRSLHRISAAGVIRDGDVLICLLRVQHASALWNMHWKHRTSINVADVIVYRAVFHSVPCVINHVK